MRPARPAGERWQRRLVVLVFALVALAALCLLVLLYGSSLPPTPQPSTRSQRLAPGLARVSGSRRAMRSPWKASSQVLKTRTW